MTAFLVENYRAVARHAAADACADPLDVRVLTFSLQPVMATLAHASAGNALALDPDHGDRLWMEKYLSWTSPRCDARCPRDLKRLTDALHHLHADKYAGIPPTNYRAGDLHYARQASSTPERAAPGETP